MHANEKNREIIKAILDLAHKLDLKVIAEGIETEEQLDLLVSLGCLYGQGFLFGKPAPPAEAECHLQATPVLGAVIIARPGR